MSRFWPTLVCMAMVGALYAPSLFGGFLNHDDPWLVRDNATLQKLDVGYLVGAWTSFQNRMNFGAEFLPARDTFVFAELLFYKRVLGSVLPQAMWLRIVSLLLFCGSIWVWGSVLQQYSTNRWVQFMGLAVFSLHPLRAESVAWIAGQKDLLALLFGGFVVWSVQREHHRIAALWMTLAMFSKSIVVVIPLMLGVEHVLGNKHSRRAIAWTALPGLGIILFQTWVAKEQHLFADKTAYMSLSGRMGGFLNLLGHYAWSVVGLKPWSMAYEVPDDMWTLSPQFISGLLLMLLLLVSTLKKHEAAQYFWMMVVAWLPVSHLLFPLQNWVADRYMLFALFGASLLVMHASKALINLGLPKQGLSWAGLLLVFLLSFLSFQRANLFADSKKLWIQAKGVAPRAPLPRLMLGLHAYEMKENEAEGIREYETGIKLLTLKSTHWKKSMNNLGILYARTGDLHQAKKVFAAITKTIPHDHKAYYNLALMHLQLGETEQAETILKFVVHRFPDYLPAKLTLAHLD